MANTVRVATQVTGARQGASELDQLRDKFDRLQKQGAKGFAIGAGAAITAGAIGLLGTAVSEVNDLVAESIRLAREDEESQNRLRASLATNVPAWNGNTAALEKYFTAQQRIGFEDNDLRDSMTILVGATHDVAEAQHVQAVAMDLARFKGISLKEASESLIKVEAGVYRSLKGLGIVLKDGATQTEALAAVEKVAAGQAEAFAQTNEGKLLASQIKISEAMEKFGYKVMPLVTTAVGNSADAISNLVTVIDTLTDGVAKTTDGQQEQMQASIDLTKALAFLNPMYGSLADAQQKMLDKSKEVWAASMVGYDEMADNSIADIERMRGAFIGSGQDMSIAVDNTASDMEAARGRIKAAFAVVGTRATDTAREVEAAEARIRKASRRTRDELKDDADALISDYWDPIIAHDRLAADKAEIAAARRIIADKSSSKEAIASARETLHSVSADMDELRLNLLNSGNLTKKEQAEWLSELQKRYATATGEAKRDIGALIAKVQELQKNKDVNIVVNAQTAAASKALQDVIDKTRILANRQINFGVSYSTPPSGPTIVPRVGTQGIVSPTLSAHQLHVLHLANLARRAGGGPVSAGMGYTVGERGPETFIPSQNGTIVPNGAGMTLNLTVHAAPGVTPAHADELGRALGPAIAKWMQRNGILPRGASPMFG